MISGSPTSSCESWVIFHGPADSLEQYVYIVVSWAMSGMDTQHMTEAPWGWER